MFSILLSLKLPLRCFICQMIVLFLLTFAAINIQENYGLQTKKVMKKTIRSTIGKYLRGHVYKVTSQAANPQHCMADCWQENDRCQSFNYIVDLDMCELNEASNITHPQDLIDRPDVVYLTNPVYGREKVCSYAVVHFSSPSSSSLLLSCLSLPSITSLS